MSNPERDIPLSGKAQETTASTNPDAKRDDKRQREIKEIRDSKIYYAEEKGREGNLETVFGAFELENPEILAEFNGRDILLKVNIVDPDHPQSCTDIATIRKVIELIKRYQPRKIYVGDVPSKMGKKGRSWEELKQIYEEKLGYKFPPDVELINLEDLENIKVEEEGSSYTVKNLDRFGGIINISRPKMHGQFGYTGCTKNLMGFMTQPTREKMIHMHEDNQSGSSFDGNVANRRLGNFAAAMLKYRPDMIHISDGSDFVVGHEHFGIPQKTDFSMVSRNPFTADAEAIKLLGLNEKRVSYLKNSDFLNSSPVVSETRMRDRIYPSDLQQKIFVYESDSNGGMNLVEIIPDPNFINNPEIKRKYVFAMLDAYKNAVMSAGKTSKEILIGIIEDVVKDKTFKDFYKYFFGEEPNPAIKEGCPYEEMPEFQDIVKEWIKNLGD